MEQRNTKRKLDEVIEYIITWLCYGDSEAAARVAYTADEKALEDNLYVLLKIDGFKFVKPVIPGDQLVITVNKTKGGGVLVGFDAVVKVGDAVFAKGSLTFTTIPKTAVEER